MSIRIIQDKARKLPPSLPLRWHLSSREWTRDLLFGSRFISECVHNRHPTGEQHAITRFRVWSATIWKPGCTRISHKKVEKLLSERDHSDFISKWMVRWINFTVEIPTTPYAHTIKSWIFPLSSTWTILYRRCRVRLCFTGLFIAVDVDQSSWQSVHVILLY